MYYKLNWNALPKGIKRFWNDFCVILLVTKDNFSVLLKELKSYTFAYIHANARVPRKRVRKRAFFVLFQIKTNWKHIIKFQNFYFRTPHTAFKNMKYNQFINSIDKKPVLGVLVLPPLFPRHTLGLTFNYSKKKIYQFIWLCFSQRQELDF